MGQNLRWDNTSRSLGSQKEWRSVSAAEFPVIRLGKPVEKSQSRCRLSVSYCHKPQTAAQSHSHSTSRGPVKDISVVRTPSILREEGNESRPQESKKFGDWKLVCMPEIKTLSHSLCENRVRTETQETRVIAFV